MSAKTSDPALERLNYFNGQRLAAADLRAEQGHHVGMRRVLNRSLYSPGVVVGLEVVKAPEDPSDASWKHKVLVRHGLAFDHLGREIFVPADVTVLVMGAPSQAKGVVFGNLLTISYRESRRHPVNDSCAVQSGGGCGGDLPWGAPSRIVADWVFEFLDSWPAEDSGRIVLGQIELNKNCEVERVMPGVRRYAVPVKPQQAQPVSIEGEKDIDKDNSKTLYFHVNGGSPDSATLYLRARRFSTLFYTELGQHTHGASVNIPIKTFDLSHSHSIGNTKTGLAGDHSHRIFVDVKDIITDESIGFGVDSENKGECDWVADIIEGVPGHSHDLTNLVVNHTSLTVDVALSGSSNISNQGVTDLNMRVGNKKALTFFRELQVKLDGMPITDLILTQLKAKPGQGALWNELGNGLGTHKLASPEGTGEIDLLKLGVELGLGEHRLEFFVDPLLADNGGNLQFNLYVS
jgi:hypothetical protein